MKDKKIYQFNKYRKAFDKIQHPLEIKKKNSQVRCIRNVPQHDKDCV